MKFRFLKKKDGTKVLQHKDISNQKGWEDVPVVEEEITRIDRLTKAVIDAYCSHRRDKLTILMSGQFHDLLKLDESKKLVYVPLDDITSFMGHRVYVVRTMYLDFKILKEL